MRNILVAVPSKKEKLPLSVTHPQLAEELLEEDPDSITAGSHKKLRWKCNLGHFWDAVVSDRARGQGCAVCAGRQIQLGYNDLSTTHPDLATQADGWNPQTVTAGSRKTLGWKCSLGHSWSARVDSRTGNSRGCPFCGKGKGGKKVEMGVNDLASLFPSIASEAVDWDPSKLTAGSSKIVKWACSEGHTWNAKVANRVGLGRGCPTCAKHGFNPSIDGFLYLLMHRAREMFQVGITNFPDQRTSQHNKAGWEVLEIRGPMDGLLTQQWETAILRMLKAKGADLSNAKIAGKFDGYSEAWSKSTFEVGSIKELMKMTEEYEEEK